MKKNWPNTSVKIFWHKCLKNNLTQHQCKQKNHTNVKKKEKKKKKKEEEKRRKKRKRKVQSNSSREFISCFHYSLGMFKNQVLYLMPHDASPKQVFPIYSQCHKDFKVMLFILVLKGSVHKYFGGWLEKLALRTSKIFLIPHFKSLTFFWSPFLSVVIFLIPLFRC